MVRDGYFGALLDPLMLDQLGAGVGDVVQIAQFSGTVEDMSLRTIKLRSYDGTLHIFPYSEAQVISNRTKLFSYAVFEFPLDHNNDIGMALELMTRRASIALPMIRTASSISPRLPDTG